MSIQPPLTFMAWLRSDAIVAAFRTLPRGAEVLEIGAGQGAMGARLAARFDYTGVEADERAATVAAGRIGPVGGRLLMGRAEVVAPSGPFDAVCAFEVLEHLDDDAGALAAWGRRLRTGGLLLLSVPAHQHRFGPADVAVGHRRRYSRIGLQDLLAASGFRDITVMSYGFPLGFALEAVRNRLAARRGGKVAVRPATAGSGRWLQPGVLVGYIAWAVTVPFRWLQRPFAGTDRGTGFVVAARSSGT